MPHNCFPLIPAVPSAPNTITISYSRKKSNKVCQKDRFFRLKELAVRKDTAKDGPGEKPGRNVVNN
jgi:hypothetical protein